MPTLGVYFPACLIK